ncbi:hypothetical protein TWF694_010951 [Orbilia ellipsospora]|uniref:Uncharacterized protein n=1 Tax=Orbilia ellipsospora TaxID=2528407 RepID=A0AAV9X7Y9_9PEZI
MLEYFSYRKFKKHQDAKEAGAQEVLDHKDEKYFEGLVHSPGAQEVPLHGTQTPASTASPTASPPDGTTPTSSDTSALPKKGTWKDTVTGTVSNVSEYATGTLEKAKQVKLTEHIPSFLVKKEKPDGADTATTDKGKEKKDKKDKKDKKGKAKMTKEDEEYFANLTPEEKELHEALDALSLAAQDGKAFSLSTETRSLLKQFTQILKDMANGVPTAYDDLIKLFETKHKQIEIMFEEMPTFLKLLAKKIPPALGMGEKAAAAGAAEASAVPGLAAQAAALGIPSLRQLATPGVVADTLKTVVNAIKLRFPGIAMGTNVVLSMALFVLLFVFWYCWKRGREVRLEKERAEQEAEEAKIAEKVLEEAPPVPTTDPSTSATTTTNTTIDEVIDTTHTSPAPILAGAPLSLDSRLPLNTPPHLNYAPPSGAPPSSAPPASAPPAGSAVPHLNYAPPTTQPTASHAEAQPQKEIKDLF